MKSLKNPLPNGYYRDASNYDSDNLCMVITM